MELMIFDDDRHSCFYPITLTRPICDLRVGILSLRQRIAAFLGIELTGLIIDSSLEDIYRYRQPRFRVNRINEKEKILFVNSRVKITNELADSINNIDDNIAILNAKNEIIATNFSSHYFDDLSTISSKIFLEKIRKFIDNSILGVVRIDDAELWSSIPELINENGNFIKMDFDDFFYEKDNYFDVETGVSVINPYNIWIGDNVFMKPGVVLDGSKGPVIIDENVGISANTVIMGPVYIGKNVKIKPLSSIGQNTTIGKFSKIGGEIEDTIIQAYSNKQHDGFLGHSYLGEWVNLGAGTNNSDLKNNYTEVQFYSYPDKKRINSKEKFLGTIIGDHSKTGIGVSLNTGCVIGLAVNLYGSKLVKDFVTSFSWGEYGNIDNYNIEKCLKTMDLVKKRRNLELSAQEKELYKKLYVQDCV